MQRAKPDLRHPPETYAAILREHHHEPPRLAERLLDFGWSLGDAAHAAMHWPPLWLAAARDAAAQSPPPPPRQTTRIIRRSPPRQPPSSEPPGRA